MEGYYIIIFLEKYINHGNNPEEKNHEIRE